MITTPQIYISVSVSVPFPSRNTANLKKWVMCGWDDDPSDESLDSMTYSRSVSVDCLVENANMSIMRQICTIEKLPEILENYPTDTH